MPTPIVLTIYGADDEPKKKFSRSIVKYGLVKKAMRLMDEINALDAEEERESVEPVIKKRPGPIARWWKKSFLLRLWLRVFPEQHEESHDERGMALLEDFVVEFFGNGLSSKDLINCDYGELMSVLVAVLARSNESAAKFPTFPQGGRRKGKR